MLAENKCGEELDEVECRVIYNNGSMAFNEGFTMLYAKLKSQLKDALIVCVDMYSIKYELLAHRKKHGEIETLIILYVFTTSDLSYNMISLKILTIV